MRSIDYAEFEKWWTHGTVRPAAGTEVFRRISNQLECKFSNFRKVRSLARSRLSSVHSLCTALYQYPLLCVDLKSRTPSRTRARSLACMQVFRQFDENKDGTLSHHEVSDATHCVLHCVWPSLLLGGERGATDPPYRVPPLSESDLRL